MDEKRVPLAVSLPFSDARAFGGLSQSPLCRSSDRQKVEQYVKALLREIKACAMDMPEVRIREIRLTGGPLHTLNEGQAERLLAALTSCFRLTPDAQIWGLATPGFFNTYPVRAMRKHAVAVMVEIPSFDREACQRHGVAFKGALSWTELEEAGIRLAGIRTSKGLERRTQAQWVLCAGELLRRAPETIEMLDGGVPQDEALYAGFIARLQQAGYRQVMQDVFSKAERPLPLRLRDEFLGVGLGAVSRFDGYETQNTPDMDAYIAADGSYDRLLVKAERI